MKKILLLVSMAALCGCQTELTPAKPARPQPAANPPTAAPQPRPTASTSKDKRAITDASLDVLKVSTSDANGVLKIEVEVQNPAATPRSFNYHLYWFTDDGTLIDLPDTISVPLFLTGHEKSSIVTMAPTPLAKDFRIKFFPVE
jgi:uncharacterized protein YcfL